METKTNLQKNGQINIILHDKRLNPKKTEQDKTVQNSPFLHVDQAFSSFIGLDKLKDIMKEVYATKKVNEKRKQLGLTVKNQVLHMLFKGNPGTGKTTVARQLAQFYLNNGLLSKGHFIEAERADLVGEYIGQTAQKTRAMIQKSLGGILFIDEAYSLARGGEKDFGKEAIDTLVTHMENNHQDFVLILAGYPYEMDNFLSLNPGLESRFAFQLEFKDFSIDQLMQIAAQMLAEREYDLTIHAKHKLRRHLLEQKQIEYHNFSNARYIRNLLEETIRKQSLRLISDHSFTANDLIKITESDLCFNKK